MSDEDRKVAVANTKQGDRCLGTKAHNIQKALITHHQRVELTHHSWQIHSATPTASIAGSTTGESGAELAALLNVRQERTKTATMGVG